MSRRNRSRGKRSRSRSNRRHGRSDRHRSRGRQRGRGPPQVPPRETRRSRTKSAPRDRSRGFRGDRRRRAHIRLRSNPTAVAEGTSVRRAKPVAGKDAFSELRRVRMFRRPARNAPESAQPLRRPDLRHVPHRIVGRHGNIMVQSCMVGRGCNGHELCHVLRDSGFDIIVVIQTEEVDVWDEVNLFLKTARAAQAPWRAERELPPYISNLLMEKAVYQVGGQKFRLRAQRQGCVVLVH